MNSAHQTFKRITIPSKNGVSPSQVFLPKGNWKTYEDFLAAQFPHITKEEWKIRMATGNVFHSSGILIPPNSLYIANQKIYYYRQLLQELKIPFQETILYQDEWLVVADKPHFLPVTPSGRYINETLLVRLKKYLKIDTLSPIHRIDRETAGIVLFSVKPENRNIYQRLFRENAVSKYYEAIAPYKQNLTFPINYKSRVIQSDSFMKMREDLGAPNVETTLDIIKKNNQLAHYLLKPITGKKHQLRLQMCSLGIPILNDRIYPEHLPEAITQEMQEEEFKYPLQLIAKSLIFTDPISGKRQEFNSQFSLHLENAMTFI